MAEIKGITPVCPHCGWAASKHRFTGNNDGGCLGVKCPWCHSDYQALSLSERKEEPASDCFTLELTEEEDKGVRKELRQVISYYYLNIGKSPGLPNYGIRYLEKLLDAMENPED